VGAQLPEGRHFDARHAEFGVIDGEQKLGAVASERAFCEGK
jgi:hypothetical protein